MYLKKVKLINHDCLPILMLLYIMLFIVLAYLMLYIVLAYLMLFAALTNALLSAHIDNRPTFDKCSSRKESPLHQPLPVKKMHEI